MRAVRTFATAVAVAALAACATSYRAAQAPLHQEQASWGMYQHSPDRNAVLSNYKLSATWSYNAKAKINSGLALVGDTLLFTTFKPSLVALNVRNGRELWHVRMPNTAMSTPIVAGNMVYVGTGNNSHLERGLKKGFSIRNILLRLQYGNKVLWGVPGGDEVAAYDLRTGALRWTHRTIGEDMPSALYDRGRLIFANGDWHAYALRADTGEQLWSQSVGGVSTMASAVQAGSVAVVAVCTDGMRKSSAIALDPSTGKILWRSPYGHCDAAPAYGEGKVFVSSLAPSVVDDPNDMSLRGRVVVAALDAQTGKPKWVYRERQLGLWSVVGSDEAAIAGTYANGTYYQPAPFTDELIAFDAATGNIRWRFHTSGPIKMSPVIAGGRLYVGDTVGLLYTLDARTSKVLELRAFKKPFTTSPPVVAGNTLIIANETTVDALPLSGTPSDGRYYDDLLPLREANK